MKIKKGDLIVVITGKDKGKKGTVMRALPDEGKIVVEKVNLCTKHQKARRNLPAGKVEFEAPIDASNVKVICPETKKSTRVGYQLGEGVKKTRVAKASGVSLEKPFVKS